MADVYYRQTKHALAIEYYKKGIKLCDETNNPVGKGFALMSIGGLYSDIGDYADAINYNLQALTEFERSDYSPGISITLPNIAMVYATIGNYSKANEYANKALALDDSKNSNEQKLFILINVGTAYSLLKDYKKSIVLFDKALTLAEAGGDMTWKNNCISNIADAYYGMQEYDSAFAKYTDALALSVKTKDPKVITCANTGLGRVLIKRGKVKEGIAYLLKSMAVAKENQIKQTIYDNALDLSNAYEQQGNLVKALEYHKIYYDYKDSLHNDKSNLRIQQLQFDYELRNKENQISLLRKDNEIEQSNHELRRIVMWASLAGVVFLLVLSIVLYRNSQLEKRNKDKILKQKEEIEAQALKLEELNRFKDKTFSVLSHDLRGPIMAFTAIVTLFDQNQITAEEFNEMKPEVNSQLDSLNILLDNLLNWAKIYMQGPRTAVRRVTDIYEITVQNENLLRNIAEKKQIRLLNYVPKGTVVVCDPDELNIIIRNLVMNAIKFTGNGGVITVSSAIAGVNLSISVTDTGVGMAQEQIDRLFTMAIDNTTYGTEGEKGTGIGLLLCYEFIKANNGSIDVTSKVNEGTTFTVLLPLPPGAGI